MNEKLNECTVAELRRRLVSREIAPRDILRSLESVIESRDERIGGYLSRDLEAALVEAGRVDVSLPLGGIPVAVKDVINVAGQPLTCASKMLGSYVSEIGRAHV
jgi:aspartyl-tRNA(Asn)/glutamyl-tRNA(Gln) amidotransferase subunit A